MPHRRAVIMSEYLPRSRCTEAFRNSILSVLRDDEDLSKFVRIACRREIVRRTTLDKNATHCATKAPHGNLSGTTAESDDSLD